MKVEVIYQDGAWFVPETLLEALEGLNATEPLNIYVMWERLEDYVGPVPLHSALEYTGIPEGMEIRVVHSGAVGAFDAELSGEDERVTIQINTDMRALEDDIPDDLGDASTWTSWWGSDDHAIKLDDDAMKEAPTTEALRFNSGKPELSEILYFAPALTQLAEHCRKGREKYPDQENGQPNWLLGAPEKQYLDSAMRHLMAHASGEEFDPENGSRHLTAVFWNIGAWLTVHYGDDDA